MSLLLWVSIEVQLLQRLGTSEVGTEVSPVSSDAIVQFLPATKKIGTIIHNTVHACRRAYIQFVLVILVQEYRH